MIGTDTHNDIAPPPYPSLGNSFHVVCLVAMGLWLIDNGNLEELGRPAPSAGAGSSLSDHRPASPEERPRAPRSTPSPGSRLERRTARAHVVVRRRDSLAPQYASASIAGCCCGHEHRGPTRLPRLGEARAAGDLRAGPGRPDAAPAVHVRVGPCSSVVLRVRTSRHAHPTSSSVVGRSQRHAYICRSRDLTRRHGKAVSGRRSARSRTSVNELSRHEASPRQDRLIPTPAGRAESRRDAPCERRRRRRRRIDNPDLTPRCGVLRHRARGSLHAQLSPDLLAIETGALERANDQGDVLLW
jgi:hypothetical protein